MQQKTKDYHGKYQQETLRPFLAYKALLQEVGRLRDTETPWPTAYLTDMAYDAEVIYRVQPRCFVWCVRPSGTHLLYDGDWASMAFFQAICDVNPESKWYVYDEDHLEGHEHIPCLKAVQPDEARAFLAGLKDGQRYLAGMTDEALALLGVER